MQDLSIIIDELRDEMIRTLKGWIQVPSVKSAPEPGAPFGREVRRALDLVLSDAAAMGFETRNFDGYAGDVRMGPLGVDPLAILVHLDVVPAGDGWTMDPFGAELFFYYETADGRLLYSLEIKDLFDQPGFVRELNRDMVPYYLEFTYVPGEETLFKGVRKLPAGGWLRFGAQGLELGRFWELTFEPDESKSLDDWADENCRENVAANGVTDRVTPMLGDVRRIAGRRYDFILANINRNILVADMAAYAAALLPGGDLVMSGFLEPDVGPIVARSAELGLRHVATQSREGWMLVHVRRA